MKTFLRTEQDSQGYFQQYRMLEDGSVAVTLHTWNRGGTPLINTHYTEVVKEGDDLWPEVAKILGEPKTEKESYGRVSAADEWRRRQHGQAAVRQAWSV